MLKSGCSEVALASAMAAPSLTVILSHSVQSSSLAAVSSPETRSLYDASGMPLTNKLSAPIIDANSN